MSLVVCFILVSLASRLLQMTTQGRGWGLPVQSRVALPSDGGPPLRGPKAHGTQAPSSLLCSQEAACSRHFTNRPGCLEQARNGPGVGVSRVPQHTGIPLSLVFLSLLQPGSLRGGGTGPSPGPGRARLRASAPPASGLALVSWPQPWYPVGGGAGGTCGSTYVSPPLPFEVPTGAAPS